MKIICVGRNYVDHIQELDNERTESPVIFLKPDTALLKNNTSFYLPTFSSEVHHEVELVLRIDREGKNIEKKFAHKYFNEISLGVDFTARDLQKGLKAKGLPWEISKGFNGSAPIGQMIPIAEVGDLNAIKFELRKNGTVVQTGDSEMMIFPFDEIIAYVSSFFTLKKGDLIYTGTPAGVGKVEIGDRLEGYIGDKKLFDFNVK